MCHFAFLMPPPAAGREKSFLVWNRPGLSRLILRRRNPASRTVATEAARRKFRAAFLYSDGRAAMNDIPRQTTEPTIITVGELKAELSRWQDNAAVTFRCPLQSQDFRFYRIQTPSNDVVQIELNQYPETPPVLP
jgi:hypothetical protein